MDNNNNNNNNTNNNNVGPTGRSVQAQRFVNLWSEIHKPNAWATIFYFLFWNPLWSTFCFAWVVSTGLIGVCSLAFPPLGYLVCIATVMSWRYVNH
jgi:hypothetical protein